MFERLRLDFSSSVLLRPEVLLDVLLELEKDVRETRLDEQVLVEREGERGEMVALLRVAPNRERRGAVERQKERARGRQRSLAPSKRLLERLVELLALGVAADPLSRALEERRRRNSEENQRSAGGARTRLRPPLSPRRRPQLR